jgi:hypothetical protein
MVDQRRDAKQLELLMSIVSSEHGTDQYSTEEWNTRINLAACYRLASRFGWNDLIYTHISAREPGPEHLFLLNPFGLLFDEVTASNLVNRTQLGHQGAI